MSVIPNVEFIEHLSDRDLLALCSSIYQDRSRAQAMSQLLEGHELNRLRATIRMLPRARDENSVLVDIGSATYWIPPYTNLGYRKIVAVTKLVDDPNFSKGDVAHAAGADVQLSNADAELDRLPLEDESVELVCCFEVLEHLIVDPMGMMAEINRVLKPGGTLALTTPNIAGWRSVLNCLRGRNANNWSVYGTEVELSAYRHHREYTVDEIRRLAIASGMKIEALYTPDLAKEADLKSRMARMIASFCILAAGGSLAHRESHTFLLATKAAGVRERHPRWLYQRFSSRG